MAPRKRNSIIDNLPQFGGHIHGLTQIPAYEEDPKGLQLYDIVSVRVTEVKALNEEFSAVLVNGKYTAKAERPLGRNFRIGEVIPDEETALQELKDRYRKEVDKARQAKDKADRDYELICKYCKIAEEMNNLDLTTEGNAYIVTDRKIDNTLFQGNLDED